MSLRPAARSAASTRLDNVLKAGFFTGMDMAPKRARSSNEEGQLEQLEDQVVKLVRENNISKASKMVEDAETENSIQQGQLTERKTMLDSELSVIRSARIFVRLFEQLDTLLERIDTKYHRWYRDHFKTMLTERYKKNSLHQSDNVIDLGIPRTTIPVFIPKMGTPPDPFMAVSPGGEVKLVTVAFWLGGEWAHYNSFSGVEWRWQGISTARMP